MKITKRTFIKAASAATLAAATVPPLIDIAAYEIFSPPSFNPEKSEPNSTVGVVFTGSPGRVEAALQLYNEGKISKLLISGAGGTKTDKAEYIAQFAPPICITICRGLPSTDPRIRVTMHETRLSGWPVCTPKM